MRLLQVVLPRLSIGVAILSNSQNFILYLWYHNKKDYFL